ncbi:glycerophosphodiester phosphodiesterase family protein [Desulfopila sp. IMCC35008]|uniref:glycerophosphodiester phosphodiesterase n=1 Tax=Desulfopila sp. IMCC35008 TaxID=2653858 RepID=UPI0013D4461B|nr:glycerophosphodiester phosphodiesterase family protein [Desulfopila sp. IMCC35008]
MAEDTKCLLIGHRGCGYPDYNQNTIRAFKKVIDEGISAIEFDVQLTADKRPIVVHNLDLSEVSTGSGPVFRTNWDAISQLYAGDPGRGKDRIPELLEVLELVAALPADKRTVMHLELKGRGSGTPCGEILRQWLDNGKLKEKDFLISSFNWQELRDLKEYCPELQIAVLSGAILRDKLLEKLPCGPGKFYRIFAYPEEDYILPKESSYEENKKLIDKAYSDTREKEVLYEIVHRALSGDFYDEKLLDAAEEMGAVAVNLWHRSLTEEFMSKVQQRGFLVNIFTINDMNLVQKWARAGVDGIFTDYYRDARNALARMV